MTNTKHDMKADGNTLKNPAEAQSVPALAPSQNELEELGKMIPQVLIFRGDFRRYLLYCFPQSLDSKKQRGDLWADALAALISVVSIVIPLSTAALDITYLKQPKNVKECLRCSLERPW